MCWPSSVIGLCFAFLLSLPAFADSLTGKVVRVVDGDTLYVLAEFVYHDDTNYKEHKIRLAGIDAPERKQAYGLASEFIVCALVVNRLVRTRMLGGVGTGG